MFYHFKNLVYLNILHTKRGIFQIALFGTGEDSNLESKYLGNHFPANLERNFISCALFEARWQTMQNMKWIQVLNFYTERCVRKKWFWLFTFVDNYDESYCIIVPANNWVHEYHHEHILHFISLCIQLLCEIQSVFCVWKKLTEKIAIFCWERRGWGAREHIFKLFFFHLVQRDPRKRRVKPVQKHLIQVDFGGADDSDDSDFELDKHKKGTVLLIPPNNNNINWFEWFEWKKNGTKYWMIQILHCDIYCMLFD